MVLVFVRCGDVGFAREFSLFSASLGRGKMLFLGIFMLIRGYSYSYMHFQVDIIFSRSWVRFIELIYIARYRSYNYLFLDSIMIDFYGMVV
jgi:hypothetical protein